MIVACVGTAILLCLIVFFCYKRNKKLEYKYSRLQHQAARSSGNQTRPGGSSFLRNETSSGSSTQLVADGGHHHDDDGADITEMPAAESCGLDEDDDDEEEEDDHQISVTVPIKSLGLVNKIRSMTTAKARSQQQFLISSSS